MLKVEMVPLGASKREEYCQEIEENRELEYEEKVLVLPNHTLMEEVQKKSKYGDVSYELKEDQILDDWASEQELKGRVTKERESVWGFVTRKIHQRKNM